MTKKEQFDAVITTLREKGLSSDEILEAISNSFEQQNQKKCALNEKWLNISKSEEKLRNLFCSLGLPKNYKGYEYLVEAVLLYAEEPNQYVTCTLYPVIAKKYNTTSMGVEAAIRHLIEKWIERIDAKTYNDFFGNMIDTNKDRITNLEFIAVCAEWLKLK